MHKWIAMKTMLTFNTFLYGFPQEYCQVPENEGGNKPRTIRAHHFIGTDKETGRFISDSMLRLKYADKKNHKDTFLDIYEGTKALSQHFKDVGY